MLVELECGTTPPKSQYSTPTAQFGKYLDGSINLKFETASRPRAPADRARIISSPRMAYVSRSNALTKFIGAIKNVTEKEDHEEYILYGNTVAAVDSVCHSNAIEMRKHGWIIGSLKGHISRMEQVERYGIFYAVDRICRIMF